MGELEWAPCQSMSQRMMSRLRQSVLSSSWWPWEGSFTLRVQLQRLLASLVLIVVVVAGVVIEPGRAQDAATPTVAPVVREVLGDGEPVAAPGQSLELVRFTIAPGTTLPAHTHPGMQVAWLEAGELEYTVITGEAPITRAGATPGTPGPNETLGEGQTTTFLPGDSWAEPEGVVHFGRNAGTEPVVILVASLFTTGAPPSNVVASATPVS